MSGKYFQMLLLFVASIHSHLTLAADRLVGVQSARVMSQSMPWIAEETDIFRRYDIEFPLVYIAGIKNHLTQSLLAKPEFKRLEDLRGKKIGVTGIGASDSR